MRLVMFFWGNRCWLGASIEQFLHDVKSRFACPQHAAFRCCLQWLAISNFLTQIKAFLKNMLHNDAPSESDQCYTDYYLNQAYFFGHRGNFICTSTAWSTIHIYNNQALLRSRVLFGHDKFSSRQTRICQVVSPTCGWL